MNENRQWLFLIITDGTSEYPCEGGREHVVVGGTVHHPSAVLPTPYHHEVLEAVTLVESAAQHQHKKYIIFK